MKTIDETAAAFYEDLHAFARGWYEDHPADDHPPMLVSLMSDGRQNIVMLQDLMTDEKGGARAASLQQNLITFRVGDVYTRCVALVIESWGRVLAEGQERGELRNELHADRIEYLIISLLTEHKQAVMMCKIDRTTGTVEKRPIQWVDKKTTSGRMIR